MVELPPPMKPNVAIVRPHDSKTPEAPPLSGVAWGQGAQALTLPVITFVADPPKVDPAPQRTNRDRAWAMLPGYDEVKVETLEGNLVRAKVEGGYARTEPGLPRTSVNIYYRIDDKGEPLIGVRERESKDGVIFYTIGAFKGTASYTEVLLIRSKVEELTRLKEAYLYPGHEQVTGPKPSPPSPVRPPAAVPTPAKPPEASASQSIMLDPTLSGYKQLFESANTKTFQNNSARKIGITIDGVSYTLSGALSPAKPPQDKYFLIPLTAAQWSGKDGRLTEARLLVDGAGVPAQLHHKYPVKTQASLRPNGGTAPAEWRAVKSFPPKEKLAEQDAQFVQTKRREALKNLIRSIPGKESFITTEEQKFDAKKFVFQSGGSPEKAERVEILFTVGRATLEVAMWKNGALVCDLLSLHDALKNPLPFNNPELDRKVRGCLKDAARQEEKFLGI